MRKVLYNFNEFLYSPEVIWVFFIFTAAVAFALTVISVLFYTNAIS
ncbi:hypothetical protein [Aequorivita echinoideorum]|nr:hypothetical protein [Aequorivita echinoideorum]